MNRQSQQLSSDRSLAERALHDFNNQVFRISLLTRSLGQKLQAAQYSDEKIDTLLEMINSAVFEASETGKGIAILVRDQGIASRDDPNVGIMNFHPNHPASSVLQIDE